MTETVEVTGGSPLLKTDRADVATHLRHQRQLTELPVLDRNFTKFILLTPGHAAARVAARRQREPAGLDPDDGERPALQRHRLPARRHREPRPDPRASSSSTRRSSRSARRRSRRRTTTRSSGRRPPASCRCRPSRARTSSTAACSSSSRTTRCRRAIRSRSPADPRPASSSPRPSRNQFGGSVGGPIVEEPDRSSSATTRARAARQGGSRLLTGADRARARRATSASTASTSSIPRAGDPACGSSSRATSSRGDRLSPQALRHPRR